jgi:ubiquinone/menaquinone biosynthesis C-methylase UbiE
MNMQTPATSAPDFSAIKTKQQAAWASGDYAVVGTTLQLVGELLCEATDIRSGQKVLDVAAGNGNATLAAARRWADVTSTDYVGSLLERGRIRAEADGLTATFREADAENLPFADGSFDAVLSTFGVMFTPNQERAASELSRVCRSGGKIGMANWTPDSMIGHLFKILGRYLPPPEGLRPPSLWGSKPHLDLLFGTSGTVTAIPRHFVFRYRSPQHCLDIFRTYYGPLHKAFAALDATKQKELEQDALELLATFNTARDGTLVAPSEYLEVVVTRK